MAITADLTRAGVFKYQTTDGRTIREWRPAEEVFHADALATLKAAPLTVNHPPGKVTPENYRRHNSGHVGDDVRRDGDKTTATVYAQDASALRAIDKGVREVSCGYHCDTEETPGIVPVGQPDAGQAYDRVQRRILYNHVALVDHGRAGGGVRLRLDSAGDQLTDGDEMADPIVKEIEIIGGIKHEVGTDAHRDARARADSAAAQLATDLKAAKDAAAAEKLRADAAAAKLAEVVEGARVELSAERMDARAAARANVVEIAREVLGKEFKVDGVDNRALKVAILNKSGGIRLDAADAKLTGDLLAGRWSQFKEAREAAKGAGRKQRMDDLRRAVEPGPAGQRHDSADAAPRTLTQIRNDAMEESEERHRRPLAISNRRDGMSPVQASQMEYQR